MLKNAKFLILSALLSNPAILFADSWHSHGKGCAPQHSYYPSYYSSSYRPYYYGSRPSYYWPSHQGYSSFNSNGAFYQGIRSGELSRREIDELRRDQDAIRREANAYRADGYLSRWEREDLNRDIKNYNKELNHELNDGEHRW